MKNNPKKVLVVYAIIDEQSNIKFASQDCEMTTSGKVVTGLQIKDTRETEVIDIPEALSCPDISDTTSEVATPQIVQEHKHISQFSKYFPDFINEAKVPMLIGRNCSRLTSMEPYVHKRPLGYSVVGNICLQNAPKVSPNILHTHTDTSIY